MLYTVSPRLLEEHVSRGGLVAEAYRLLEEDEEASALLHMSNVMAVGRLRYNDHGVVHARIVAGTALTVLDLLLEEGVEPTTLRDGTTRSLEEVRLLVLLAAYLHDIGNAVHREGHEHVGALLAKDILDRLLPRLGLEGRARYMLRQEVMHSIYATDYSTRCLTVECGVVKISDGLDMAEGRARVPYRLGKLDMHAVSALSIKRVEVGHGERPLRITVYMDDMAGLFQVEEVLTPKIETSSIADKVEVVIDVGGKPRRYYPR